jgi:hypothetical protein
MNNRAPAAASLTPACFSNQAIFSSPDLDYIAGANAHKHLDLIGHTMLAHRKAQASAAAVDVCFGCPRMVACEQEDIANDTSDLPFVPGVIGGRTEAERRVRRGEAEENGTEALVLLDLPQGSNAQIAPGDRGPRNQVDDELVARLTQAGRTSGEIAALLGCSQRTVSRARIRMGVGMQKVPVPVETAEATLDVANPFVGGRQVSAPMSAIYDHLAANNGVAEQEVLVRVGAPHVDPREAIEWWEKQNHILVDGKRVLRPTKANFPIEDRIAEGSRAKVLNAVSATFRKGRYLDRTGDTYTFKASAMQAWCEQMHYKTLIAA